MFPHLPRALFLGLIIDTIVVFGITAAWVAH
jgi:hypothetical protein